MSATFSCVVGIDGPAAFLSSEPPDIGMKIQILSVSQSQSQSQPESQSQSQSPAAEEPERDGDTETLLEPKTDIHELLQKQGDLYWILGLNHYSEPCSKVKWNNYCLPAYLFTLLVCVLSPLVIFLLEESSIRYLLVVTLRVFLTFLSFTVFTYKGKNVYLWHCR